MAYSPDLILFSCPSIYKVFFYCISYKKKSQNLKKFKFRRTLRRFALQSIVILKSTRKCASVLFVCLYIHTCQYLVHFSCMLLSVICFMYTSPFERAKRFQRIAQFFNPVNGYSNNYNTSSSHTVLEEHHISSYPYFYSYIPN